MIEVRLFEQTASSLPAHTDWLTAGEAACLASMRFPKRRADWLLGRWTAKQAVAACLQVAPEEIEVLRSVAGIPVCRCLRGHPAPGISLSHSRDRALCAVAPAGVALGCDLEFLDPRSAQFIADYFTPEEQAVIGSDSRLATLFWSAKESALKALGIGLNLDTRDVSITADLTNGTLEARTPWGRVLHGQFWQAGDFIRTFLSDPPPHFWPVPASP